MAKKLTEKVLIKKLESISKEELFLSRCWKMIRLHIQYRKNQRADYRSI